MHHFLRWLIFCVAALAAASAQETWTQQSAPTTQDLWSVCSNPFGLFVAVGTGGAIVTSSDGITWTAQSSGTTNWLVGVTYGNGLYVAVGDQGIILTSPDAVHWTTRVAGGGTRLNGVSACSLFFLAVGEGGTALSSPDGITWTPESTGTTDWLHGIAYDGLRGLFWISGQSGTLLTTKDGMTYSVQSSGTTQDIEGAATFPAASPDGAFAGTGGYLATTNSNLVIFNLTVSSPIGATHFQGVGCFGQEFIAVGEGGTIATSYQVRGNWQTVPSGTTATLYAAAGGPSQAVVVGQGGVILTSPLRQGLPVSSGIIGPAAPTLGATVSLSATATGQDPFTYQWSFAGQPIAGATSATLVLPALQATQNGVYTLTVTNPLGSTAFNFTVSGAYHPSIPGLVDESFNPALSGQIISSLAVQSDGKVLLVENSGTTGSPQQNLLRLLPDGTLDTAFTTAADQVIPPGIGLITGLLQRSAPGINFILPQGDGKILVAGSFVEGGTGVFPWKQSWRLNSDGTPDTTYTPHQAVGGPIPTQDLIPQVQLEDGQYLTVTGTGIAMVVRLTANGAIDSTFTPYSPPAITAGGAGQLIAGANGQVIFEANNPNATTLNRLNSDGSLDASFSSPAIPGLFSVLPLPSGQLIVTSYSVSSSTNPAAGTYTVQRLNNDGSVDPSYAGLTLASSNAANGVAWQILATALASDGSLYVDVGLTATASASGPLPLIQGTYRNGMIRIDPSGNFDPSFTLNWDVQPASTSTIDLPPAVASPITGLLALPSGQAYFWNNFVGFNGEARAALVRVNPSVGANFASLANLSARGNAGTGAASLTVGFVTSGPASKSFLLRGAGPSLTAFGVSGALADPQLTLYDAAGNVQQSNNNWQDGGQGPSVAAAATVVGAFAFASGSLDAALLTTLSPGTHSFAVSGIGGTTGIALAEAYDADPARPIYGGARAVNFSFRGSVGTGSGVLTAGFVIAGNNSKRVLIRAIGPALAGFGVSGAIPDPVLTVFSNNLAIAQQQMWNSQSELGSTFTDVGAFTLPTGSADSAVVMTLAPGDYTAVVVSASGAAGLALVEIYEVP
jgi:uncharacterized delta-60 repeat protein